MFRDQPAPFSFQIVSGTCRPFSAVRIPRTFSFHAHFSQSHPSSKISNEYNYQVDQEFSINRYPRFSFCAASPGVVIISGAGIFCS